MTGGAPPAENRYTGILLAERYVVGELTTRDAVTETHLAQDRQSGATVSIKFLSPQLAEDHEFAQRFVDDALAATILKAPEIVGILDAGTSDAMRYVVQEHVEGQTLGQMLETRGKFDPSAACAIMSQVLKALTVAHSAGIVHGAINPSNIILTGPGSARLLDLGMARVRSSRTIAESRAMMAHPGYVSPEEARGDVVGFAADIYSSGIIFYEMLTGKPPFGGDSPVAVFHMHARDLPEPITLGHPYMPSPIADTVAKALMKKPEDRFQNADQFRRAVELALSLADRPSATAPSTTEPAAVTAQPAGKRRVKKAKEPKPTNAGTRIRSITSGSAGMHSKTMIFSPAGPRKWPRMFLIGVSALLLIACLGLGVRSLLGPGGVQVPQLAQMQRDDALRVLADAGLRWKISEEESSAFAPGSVMRQAPAAGASVPKGTQMLLTIAKAPAVVRVPDLTGVLEYAAEDRLKAAGIQIGRITEEVNRDYYEGTVIAQDPTAGTVVTPDTKVNLTIAVGKQPDG